jgi:PhzF family phenazine biosynthesis protein
MAQKPHAYGISEIQSDGGDQMAFRILQIDAFTSEPFCGNPAAVCLLTEARDEKWMQAVAREMNLSETAFLLREKDGFRLRWFTPAVEVELCGHATLASAHALWEEGILGEAEQARFFTQSGLLGAVRTDDGIELDFPAKLATAANPPPGLIEALGVQPLYVGKSAFDYLLLFGSESTVRDLSPDFVRLRKVEARGIIVTARSDDRRFDFVSRFFAPASGIDEDPVTGSTHCTLGSFWQERMGKQAFHAHQVSSRGGTLRVRVQGDRIYLTGNAVTVLRGELRA